MRVGAYKFIRDLHLYLGLFVSPFVLIFAVSVFFFVHSCVPKFSPEHSNTRAVSGIALGTNVITLTGRALIEAIRPALEKVDIHGEIGFVRHLVNEQQLIIPVTIPGRETLVRLNLASRDGTITTRETGLADALIKLHVFPGPHSPDTQKNWLYLKVWSWLSDATVYLLLLVTVTGLYLWYALRAERRVGLILLLAGTICFFGMVYVVSR